MIVRLTCSLITIAMLTAACGADRSDVVGDDLAAAQKEIARLEALLVEQPEAVGNEEPVVREVSGSPYSVGPCGIFTLNGTRVMKLSYEVDEERSRGTMYNPMERSTWVETGVDFGNEYDAQYAYKQQGGWNWTSRSPAVSFGVRLVPDWNHAWYVAWEIPPTFPDTSLLWRDLGFPRNLGFPEEHWSRPGPRGFFGLDQNCEWHWIGPSDDWPYHGALDAASIRLKVGEDGEAQLVEYTVFADVRAHFRSFLKNIHRLPAVYDLESHTFIIQCPDE
jgi:hypothetical protein